ncbi:hypothetical protein WJX84_006083 [Apatococcus fuscideae]|uniref:Uncharacterized protein n=1 Tax=Apatococcus fuscideae TaxID=2026836 RepID=A0AAW1SZB3_9CHLO
MDVIGSSHVVGSAAGPAAPARAGLRPPPRQAASATAAHPATPAASSEAGGHTARGLGGWGSGLGLTVSPRNSGRAA